MISPAQLVGRAHDALRRRGCEGGRPGQAQSGAVAEYRVMSPATRARGSAGAVGPRSVPGRGLGERRAHVPDAGQAELVARLGTVEQEQRRFVRLGRRAGGDAPRAAAPRCEKGGDDVGDRQTCCAGGAEVPGAVAGVAVAQQAGAQPEIAGERLEHVLPGPHGAGVAYDHLVAAAQRPDAVGHQAIARPVSPADHVAGPGAGHAHRRAGPKKLRR